MIQVMRVLGRGVEVELLKRVSEQVSPRRAVVLKGA
jgi:hypothetical protein